MQQKYDWAYSLGPFGNTPNLALASALAAAPHFWFLRIANPRTLERSPLMLKLLRGRTIKCVLNLFFDLLSTKAIDQDVLGCPDVVPLNGPHYGLFIINP